MVSGATLFEKRTTVLPISASDSPETEIAPETKIAPEMKIAPGAAALSAPWGPC